MLSNLTQRLFLAQAVKEHVPIPKRLIKNKLKQTKASFNLTEEVNHAASSKQARPTVTELLSPTR